MHTFQLVREGTCDMLNTSISAGTILKGYALKVSLSNMEDNKLDQIDTEIYDKKKKDAKNRLLELNIWMFLGLLLSGRTMFEFVIYGPSSDLFQMRYFEIILSLIVIIFPVLFRLIFSRLPLESLRASREVNNIRITNNHGNVSGDKFISSNVEQLISKKTSSESPEEFLTNLTLNSRELAQSLYSRSGVYLLIGVLIAFSGLAFFYLQTTTIIDIKDPTSILIALAPKFGILFFIEFIALFFLKQYKSAMDEFRYYESLQRSREETLAIVKLINASESELNVYELIEKCGFRSTIDKLENGQSTDLLESKKLNKDETELFGKILDIVGKRN